MWLLRSLSFSSVFIAFDVLLEGFTKCLTTLTHSSQVFQLVEEYERVRFLHLFLLGLVILNLGRSDQNNFY